MKLKEIESAPDYYVSDTGKVYSTKSGCVELLKPAKTSTGYELYQMWKGKERVQIDGHRLVALAFIDNPDNKPYVNHINGVKTDNRVENLEWVTPAENYRHAVDTGLIKNKGVDNSASKHTELQIHEVCRLLKEDVLTSLDIEDVTGVSHRVISLIRLGKAWTGIAEKYNLKRKNQKTLPDEIVIEMCDFINKGVPLDKISDMYDGFPVRYIRDIKNKKRYKKITRQYIH